MSKHMTYLGIFFLITATVIAAPPSEEGRNIFTARCASCHNVNKELTGPALAGIDQRRPLDWIIKFVHSSQAVVKSGDPYAVSLFNKYNKIPMPDHPDLTAENIKGIVEYIKSETRHISADKPPFAKPSRLRPGYIPLSLTKDLFFFVGFLGLTFLLVLIMYFAVEVKSIQRHREKEGQ